MVLRCHNIFIYQSIDERLYRCGETRITNSIVKIVRGVLSVLLWLAFR